LLIDESGRFQNEVFWVGLELSENSNINPAKDSCYSLARKLGISVEEQLVFLQRIAIRKAWVKKCKIKPIVNCG
jgi:hypothetical protein